MASEQIATFIVNPSHLVMLVGVGLLLGVAVFALLAVIISMLNYQETPVRDRLLMLRENGSFEGGTSANGAFDDLKEALITFSEPLSKKLYGQNVKLHKQVKGLLTEAGLPDTEDQVWRFMARRAAAGLVGSAICFVLVSLMCMDITYGLCGLLGGFFLGSLIPQFQLKSQGKKRKVEIRYNLPDALDLMVVCVEAGLSLDATIQRAAEEMEMMAPEISHEFKRLNKELNAGISRIEAFQNLGQRAGVDELRSLCAMIVQADKMGTSVAETLRVYTQDLRTKRRQKAEELASKASIKMTFPLVLFIFPPLFIVLMGPIVIKTILSFMK